MSNRAVKFFTSEKYSDALKYSEEAILADEKNYQAYTLKAQILIKKNKLNEPEETIQEQLKIKPEFAEAYTFKGLINILNGNKIKADQGFIKSIQLFEKRNNDNNCDPQINDTNIYFSLLLIGDLKSVSSPKNSTV